MDFDQYEQAKEIFLSDELEKSLHFDSLTFAFSKNQLTQTIKKKENPLIFLIGDPGCGKTYLLKYLEKEEDEIKLTKYFTYPFFNEKEFLEILLSLINQDNKIKDYNPEKILNILKKNFSNYEHVIAIDEAHHLNKEMIELIRILSDQGIFQFILAMHKNEAEKIVQKPQFKTRNPKIITIEYLNDEEVLRYIQEVLINNNLATIASEFKKSHIKQITKYTKKNFRAIKKLLIALFDIIIEAKKRNLTKYAYISKHTITMAAIDTGMIDVK